MCVATVVIILLKRKTIWNSVLVWGLLFSVYCALITVSSGMYQSTRLVYAIIDIVYWLVIFSLFYLMQYQYEVPGFIYKISAILFFITLFAVIWTVWSNQGQGDYEQRDVLLNSIYYVIFLLPMVFLIDNKKFHITVLIFAFLAALISNKRTALLVMVLVIVIWIFLQLKSISLSQKLLYIVLLSFLGVLVYFAFAKLSSVFNISVFDRMEAFLDGSDQGSGRFEIWADTFKQIGEDDWLSNLVGRGRRSVSMLSKYSELSESHNDALQYLFDYGFVGFVMYVGILISLVSYSVRMKKNHYKWFAPYVMSLVIFFVCSTVSMVMVYPYWFLSIAMFWGIVIGDYDKTYGKLK